ncbi:hypothetical protein G7Y89_g1500 [Cudoniella acicularis]|uniref:ACB domain-containing protein n=1 Tax=Cudoniella acicularis TaxID=354080 RepID=A0A8H4W7U9_9HELO|nr:hypothetical protein G7Y89_g1500 [Cudoniella acicularis]
MGNTPSTPSRSSTVKRQRNSSPAKSSSKTRSSKIYYADKVRERCASGKRTFIVLKDENEDTFRKEQNRLSSRPDGYYMTEKSGIRAKRQSMPSLEDRPWSGELQQEAPDDDCLASPLGVPLTSLGTSLPAFLNHRQQYITLFPSFSNSNLAVRVLTFPFQFTTQKTDLTFAQKQREILKTPPSTNLHRTPHINMSAFDIAVKDSKKLTSKPSNDDLLKLYGLFKVANGEDISKAETPGTFDLKGKAKKRAWQAVVDSGITAEQAKADYVKFVEGLKKTYGYNADKEPEAVGGAA